MITHEALVHGIISAIAYMMHDICYRCAVGSIHGGALTDVSAREDRGWEEKCYSKEYLYPFVCMKQPGPLINSSAQQR